MIQKENEFIVVPAEGFKQKDLAMPTEKEIEEIREELKDKDLIESEEIKKLSLKRKDAGRDKIALAHLFIECVDNIKDNLNKVKAPIGKKELLKYIKRIGSQKLRDLIEDYENGESYGSHYTGLKIKDVIKENQRDIENIVSIFFTIFKEDE